MAQTTGAISWANAQAEAKIGAGSWADHGGVSSKLEASGFERQVGSAFTAIGNTPVLTAGKLNEGELKLLILYTEVTGEAWKLLYDAYLNGDPVQFRWTPKGTGTGNYQYTSAAGFLKNVTPPTGDWSKADPVMCEATLVTPSYSRATLA